MVFSKFSKIPLSVEGGALARYLEELRELDLLTPAEEQELAYRVQQGDEEAKNQLIQANLRFVITVAKEYRGQGLSLSDLISEGNLGLIEAIGRFDPALGFKLISYAVWWIRHAILSALADRGRPVRIPQSQIARLRRILQVSRRLEQETGHRPSAVEIAGELEVEPEQVDSILAMGRRHKSLDASFDHEDDDDRTLLDVIGSGEPSPEEEAMSRVRHEEIQEMLGTLDPREAEIIRLYYGIGGQGPMKLDEIGQLYGLTRERVRQIRERALDRLRHPSRRPRLKKFWEEVEV